MDYGRFGAQSGTHAAPSGSSGRGFVVSNTQFVAPLATPDRVNL